MKTAWSIALVMAVAMTAVALGARWKLGVLEWLAAALSLCALAMWTRLALRKRQRHKLEEMRDSALW